MYSLSNLKARYSQSLIHSNFQLRFDAFTNMLHNRELPTYYFDEPNNSLNFLSLLLFNCS